MKKVYSLCPRLGEPKWLLARLGFLIGPRPTCWSQPTPELRLSPDPAAPGPPCGHSIPVREGIPQPHQHQCRVRKSTETTPPKARLAPPSGVCDLHSASPDRVSNTRASSKVHKSGAQRREPSAWEPQSSPTGSLPSPSRGTGTHGTSGGHAPKAYTPVS